MARSRSLALLRFVRFVRLVPAGLVALGALLPRAARGESPPRPPYVVISNVSVTEGDAGRTPFAASVSLANWSSSVTVTVSAIPGTADTSDYVFAPQTLTLIPGGAAQTVKGEILGDIDPEGDESFELRATLAGGAFPTPYPYYVASEGGRVQILDDDLAKASRLHVEGARVLEGDSGITRVEVRVRLEPASQYPVSVDFQTIAGTAREGSDFTPASGTLRFAVGEVLKTVTLMVLGDTVWEPEERFAVELTNPRQAVLGTARADVVIANDDPASVVTLDDLRLPEGSTGRRTVELKLRFDRPVEPLGKVQILRTGGSATPGEDFVLEPRILYPRGGDTSVSATMEIIGDTTPECDEGIVVSYRASYTGDDAAKSAKILIVDDDEGPRPDACPDPFTTVAAPRDGGAKSAPDAAADGAGSVPAPGSSPGPGAGPDAAPGPDVRAPIDGAALLDQVSMPGTVSGTGTDAGTNASASGRARDGGVAVFSDSSCTCALGKSGRGGVPPLVGPIAIGLAFLRATRRPPRR